MSNNRRTFYGIAPTWIAVGNGKQIPEFIDIKSISVACDIAFLGDVNPTINLGVSCNVDTENLDLFHTMSVLCSTTFLGDVNPLVTMNNIFVVVSVTGP